jgi:predicted DNA-binding protein (MmcQ/YjbR family)
MAKAAKKPEQPPSKRTMAVQQAIEAKPGATAHPATVRGVTLYKVMNKMFAILSVRNDAFVILKSDPHLAEVLREQYKGIGHRSHLDRRFWIAVTIDADVPLKQTRALIDQSYDLIREGLTRKQQAELDSLSR